MWRSVRVGCNSNSGHFQLKTFGRQLKIAKAAAEAVLFCPVSALFLAVLPRAFQGLDWGGSGSLRCCSECSKAGKAMVLTIALCFLIRWWAGTSSTWTYNYLPTRQIEFCCVARKYINMAKTCLSSKCPDLKLCGWMKVRLVMYICWVTWIQQRSGLTSDSAVNKNEKSTESMHTFGINTYISWRCEFQWSNVHLILLDLKIK